MPNSQNLKNFGWPFIFAADGMPASVYNII